MSSRVVCSACGHHNSSHRVTCKGCRIALASLESADTSGNPVPSPIDGATPSGRAEMRAEGRRNMLFGGAWCVGGILFTAVSYSSANPGDTYIVAWGAVLFGAAQFLKGISQYVRATF